MSRAKVKSDSQLEVDSHFFIDRKLELLRSFQGLINFRVAQACRQCLILIDIKIDSLILITGLENNAHASGARSHDLFFRNIQDDLHDFTIQSPKASSSARSVTGSLILKSVSITRNVLLPSVWTQSSRKAKASACAFCTSISKYPLRLRP